LISSSEKLSVLLNANNFSICTLNDNSTQFSSPLLLPAFFLNQKQVQTARTIATLPVFPPVSNATQSRTTKSILDCKNGINEIKNHKNHKSIKSQTPLRQKWPEQTNYSRKPERCLNKRVRNPAYHNHDLHRREHYDDECEERNASGSIRGNKSRTRDGL
jgi:hypothetical protein